MKVLILSGSRNREGQTARIIKAVQKGLTAGKAESEVIFLVEKNIERCRMCDPDGWGQCRRDSTCIIDDDCPVIIEKVKAADALVFANPVYFLDLSESMRSFLDRYRRTLFKPGKAPVGFGMPGGTPAIGICFAGGSGYGTPSCSFNLERILQNCGLDVVDMINVRRQNIEVKLPQLEIVGKWLATRPTSGTWPPPQDKKK
jgi:NAD(P)H-dependent FMN reductase